MMISNRSKAQMALLAGCLIVLVVSLLRSEPPMLAQDEKHRAEPGMGSGNSAEGSRTLHLDEYQRSGQVLYMQRFGKDGADRGKEIYYTKCWICHNEFAVASDPTGAPTLKGLFQRAKLMTGKVVGDETVRSQIKDGSPRMPAYKWGLSDKDLDDLMAYLKTECCWDPDHPPANPLFKAK